MGFRMSHTLVAALVVLLLAGCVPGDPIITPEPEPDATPVFASDDEALAAATEAYAKYLEVSNLIRADGGTAMERIADFVTPGRLDDELNGFKSFSDQGISTVGDIRLDGANLQQYSADETSPAIVTMYVCLDATEVHIVDSHGADVTPTDRPDRQLFEVRLESSATEPSKLLLARSELWSGQDGC
jgi:hypothetical protein